MGFISLAVIGYQLVIGVLVFYAYQFGKLTGLLATVGAAIWTLTHVFYAPLMILQFLTIIVATFIGVWREQNA